MIGFVLCSFLLAVLVQNQNEFLPFLTTPVALGVGLTVMAISLLAGYLRKVPTVIWHDGFASSCLLIWYAYWVPQFNDDAPMFFFFPLYYALLTSIVTLTLINKSPYFDQESIEHLRYLEKNSHFNISTIVVFVLVSLLVTRHYALYPIAMTFFIVRHAMTACLETIDS
ncbi:MAG: hypothetical protein Q7T96_06210 [Methylobacter sp.]|nr:hypothetical protein [Methylobacter sp.]